MDYVQLLEQFSSSDNQQRRQAENELLNRLNSNFPDYAAHMMEILVNQSYPIQFRQMAGTLFKRSISSLSGEILQQKQEMWKNIDSNLRQEIKNAMLQCLGDSNVPVRNAAASAISAIAKIELPIGLWDSLFDGLKSVIDNPSIDTGSRVACIQVVRYICEDLTDMDDAMVMVICTMLLDCFQSTQPEEIWEEAIQALKSALFFAESFMSVPSQCSRVMQAVLDSCQSPSLEVQCEAFDCLTVVFEDFYPLIDPYFDTFYALCAHAVGSDEPQLSIHGSLTLAALFDEEFDRLRRGEEDLQLSRRCGAKLAAGLCGVMVRQDENDSGETMTPSLAAATCLRSLAGVLQNDLVGVVWPFIQEHIEAADWHYKEAAIMVFGCILHGPSKDTLRDLISSGTPLLIGMVASDPSIAVRDSAAWVLSQITESFLDLVPAEQLPTLLACLVDALDLQPRVAQHAAAGISSVCDAAAACGAFDLVKPFYEPLLRKLLSCAQRMDFASNQLRENAVFALMSLIACAVPGSEGLLFNFYQFILGQCEGVLNVQGGDQEHAYQLQRFYCIALVALLERLKEYMPIEVHRIARLAYNILSSSNTSAHMQAILLYQALLIHSGSASLQFIDNFLPFVVQAISQPNDVSTCRVAISCLSDLLLTIGSCEGEAQQGLRQECMGKVSALRGELIPSVVGNLESAETPSDIKPDLFTCLSCFFWELKEAVLPFVPRIVAIANAAANAPMEVWDEGDQQWVERLYCSVVELWDSMSEVVFSMGQQEAVGFLDNALGFVGRIMISKLESPQLAKAMMLMLRDIGCELKESGAMRVLNSSSFNSLYSYCVSLDGELRQVAEESKGSLNRVGKPMYQNW